jgi:hypothetical protein
VEGDQVTPANRPHEGGSKDKKPIANKKRRFHTARGHYEGAEEKELRGQERE